MKTVKPTYIKYEDYLLEDFLSDEFFIEWVKRPNENNKHFWERWIAEHPQKRHLILEAGDFIQRMNYARSPELSDKNYVQIFENVIRHDPSDRVSESNKIFGFRRWLFTFKQIAAVLILGLALWYFWDFQKEEIVSPVQVATRMEKIHRATPKGQKTTFILEDGTKIFLNSGSEITFPKSFDKEIREVSLKGEAFFEVAEEKRPFVVHSNNLAVQVLGTSFNVREAPDGVMSVALLTGKVRIDDQKGNRLILAPREMMVFNQSGEFLKTGFDPAEVTAWKDKVLIFKSNSIGEVKDRLENWYGVEVQLKGGFPSNWSYSGVYRDETLENVLSGLVRTTDLEFSLKDKQVVLTHK